ncbi:MAG TPA: hypothetical protein VMU74_08480 [Gaiellaceae bacterium]|nr:hypothetical protein [Gaiellaceae bacterium]
MPGVVSALALTIALSSHAAGAQVQIAVRATYDMQCGWPGPRIEVVLPSAERLPARITRTSVLVDGKPPAAVARSGQTVSLTIVRPSGAMCDVIGPGVARIVFTHAAHIGNPGRTGRYRLSVRHGSEAVSGAFSIR